jgi:parvulin-like peptidyl-prolyl isomerase
MMHNLIFATAIFLPSGHAEVAKNAVVATINGKKITYDEFKKRYDEVKRQSINAPPPDLFLEDLVRYEVGVEEAEKRNLRNDPQVQERFRQELYKALVEKAIGQEVQKIQVSEKEMQEFYKKNPELRTSHILIEVKADATPDQRKDAKKRGEDILAEVRRSKRPFEELVKLYTDDTLSRSTGGDIGYQSRVTLVPPYYEAALGMRVGDIKGLVETQYGYHIVKLTGRRAYDQANKRQLRAAVFDEKRKEIFDNYFKNLKSKYRIEVNKNLVKNSP